MADTPALDVLLKRVRDEFSDGETDRIGERFLCYHAAPRLAAIVRVLRDALDRLDDTGGSMWSAPSTSVAVAALSRADAIARGE